MNKRQITISILLSGIILLFMILAASAGPKERTNTETTTEDLSHVNLDSTGTPLQWPEKIPATELAAFFGNSRESIQQERNTHLSVPNGSGPEADGREQINWIQFVGTMTNAFGQRLYYFKDNRTGRIEALTAGGDNAPWKLKEATDTFYILEIDGREYEIQR